MATPVVLIDYGAGNLHSVQRALERAGAVVERSADPERLARRADRILLPGVGAFVPAARRLRELHLDQALCEHVRAGRPLLGICLGMQLLFEDSAEPSAGQTETGLGLLRGHVLSLPRERLHGLGLHVPHMGWNRLDPTSAGEVHPLLAGVRAGGYAYFIHSYHAVCADGRDLIATTDHGGPFAAAVAHENLWGMQFHPEKSAEVGARMLENYLAR